MKILLQLILAFVFSVQFGWAVGKYETAKKLEAEAESYFSIDEYAKALPYYVKLDSLLPGNAEYTYKIGVCMYNTDDKKKSLDYFLKAKARNVTSENMNFFLARAYHFNYQFDSAIYYYQAYSNFLEKEGRHSKKSKEELSRFVKNCENGKAILTDTMMVTIENIGKNINTAFPEYAPVVSADDQTLYFTSRRDNTTGGGIDEDGKYFEDIYVCTKQSDGTWSTPKQLGAPINTVGHDACIGLSPDGQKLFIYKSDKDSKSGDIFISEIKNGTYTAPVKLEGGVNTAHRWENSSSITTDDKVLFFTSNRRGGYGGMDIYMSRRLPNNTWSQAFNLGPAINTPYDEDSPQIHSDGKTLFFSSKGHNSIGGFDIFSSIFNEKDSTWTTPKNMGFPVNSADDDIFFNYIKDGSKGYFASYRDDSYGEKDIYMVSRPKSSSSMLVMRGKIFEKGTKTPVSATITLVNKATGETEQVANSQPNSGRYSSVISFKKTYAVTVSAKGYLPATDEFTIEERPEIFDVARTYNLDKAPEEPKVDTTVKPVVVKVDSIAKPVEKVVENPVVATKVEKEEPKDTKPAKPVVVREPLPVEIRNFKNIYFDYKVNELPKKAKADLNNVKKYLLADPSYKIRVIGYADSVGPDAYNEQLSLKRAKAVADYLKKIGVPETQVIVDGKGEINPLGDNGSKKGRSLNRRAELVPEK